MTARWEPQPTISPWTAGLVILETALVCLIVVLGVMGALTTFVGGGSGPWRIAATFWGIANLVTVSLVVAGALQTRSAPRRGTALLAIGAVAMAALWYWAWIVSVPFAIVLIAVAVLRALNSGAPRLHVESKGVKS